MAQLWDVTAASDTVHLDSKGEGQISFTASNVCGHAVRGRAQLVALDTATKAWLSLAVEPEYDFPVRGTRQFAVKVTAPAGSKANKYTFRLDVANLQNPQEDYTQGPTIAFEVKKEEPKAKKPPYWIIPVAAVVLIALGGVLYFALRPSKVTVPDVTHKPIDDAKQALAQAKLQEADTEQTTTGSPAGQVISQQPNAGTSVEKGATIALVVAAAPTRITVPNMLGHSVPDANTTLTLLRLKVGTVTSRFADPDSVDKILNQQPKDGDQVPADTPVDLVVGSVSVRVPNVVGQPYPEAVAMLQRQRLSPGKVTNSPGAAMRPGVVLSTRPDAGQAVATGSSVDMFVQEETVPVPNLTNQSVSQAVISLQSAKLKLGEVRGKMTWLNVIGSAPRAGVRVAVGSEVDLIVPGPTSYRLEPLAASRIYLHRP